MLHIRIHRLELARHRIERDLKRLAMQHSREPRGGVFKQHSLRAAAQLEPAGRKSLLLMTYRGEMR
jgi:hypothetical protein